MIILDTNVISEAVSPSADPVMWAWLNRQLDVDLWTSATTVAELRYGANRLPGGARRSRLQNALDEILTKDFRGRIAPFDVRAANEYGTLVAIREAVGRPISMGDGQIAAICRVNHAALATRNTKDFKDLGIELINPWNA